MTDDIEDLEPIEIEAEIDADDLAQVTKDKPRRGVGYPVFLLGLLFASALGAFGGGAAAYYLSQQTTAAPTVDLSPMQKEIASLETAVARLKNAPAVTPETSVDLTPLQDRLKALEMAPAPQVPSIDPDLLTRLEALQAEGSPAMDMAAFEQRIDSLETAGMPEDLRADVQDLFERLAEWEIRLDDFREEIRTQVSAPAAAQPAPVVAVEPVIIRLPFPKAALLAAVDEQPATGGFLERTMSKHIKVKDENSPSVMIDAVEAALARGDFDTAKSKFDQLPSTIRSAGQDWRNSID